MCRFWAVIIVAACVSVSPRRAPLLASTTFDSKTASFAITVSGETSAYRDVSAFVIPGESLTITAVGGPPGDYRVIGDSPATSAGPRAWRWHAPDTPATYRLRVVGPAEKDAIDLHVFVMVPATEVKDGWLREYRVGLYPPPKGNPLYRAPSGFVEVTKANEETRISPHFTLRQFVCKESPPSEYPKFVALNPRLPLELEAVLEEVNTLGFAVDTLHVMSAYRTPFYNHAIGDVPYSMHQWGSAADIYVDRKNHGEMDDLNSDGRVDVDDARFLYGQIETLLTRPEYRRFEGGLGFYPATAAHPPFVHVDVRGTRARWRG